MSAGGHTARFRWTSGSSGDAVSVVCTERRLTSLCAFAALAAYGVLRWATLLKAPPTARLAGVLAASLALATLVPAIARRSRALAWLAALALALAAFPIAGLPWQWARHLRLALSARTIADGLRSLPGALVPYAGHARDVRLVVVLGAAVLLFDAAAVLALCGGGGRGLSDARRGAVALPLVALAVVPDALVAPQFPYLQGLLLFGLLSALLWGDRLRAQAGTTAVAALATAAAAAAILAPRIAPRRPWLDYRAWGAAGPAHVDVFDWNQTYGPLSWPRSGRPVLSIAAATPSYWLAQDLDEFDGRAWVASPLPDAAPPAPAARWRARWTQTISVRVLDLRTPDVIGGGYSSRPLSAGPQAGGRAAGAAARPLPGVLEGDPGTWTFAQPAGPGTRYRISSYDPRPTAAQLARAGRRYPAAALAADLTLSIPISGVDAPPLEVTFPPFHSRGHPSAGFPAPVSDASSFVRDSPYGRAWRLALRLARRSPTPYAFVEAVMRHLAHGYAYNEDPPAARWPLEAFLFSTREGYCQQFSGAMALLLRMGGVPARVAAGFTPGVLDRATHRFIVTDIDAHAWVEVWFPSFGWVRFDPTPASAPARAQGGAGRAASRSTGAARGLSPAAVRRHELGLAEPAGRAGAARHGRGGGAATVLLGVLAPALGAAGALAALVALALRLLAAMRDPIAELELAWARTRRPVATGTTLAALERRLATAPEAAAYVRAVRMARYADGPPPTRAQRRALRRELARGLGAAGALRALWALPPGMGPRGRRADP
ncbi:MAG TPA: transglutaminase-like domain-containing protein [Solirubrobacteraceae bacterium]|nr:transglutaminase-like domain-containing protein [Solirubrobacteraceae bacterium]